MITKLSLLLLTGCMANNSLVAATLAQENIYGLSQVSVGMTEREVLNVMPHPHNKKTIEHEGGSYEVWFYITRGTTLTQDKLVRQNITPLTFEKGVLVGWGFDYYDGLIELKEERTPTIEHKKHKSLQKELDTLDKKSSTTPSDTHEENKPLQDALDINATKPLETTMNKKPPKQEPKKKKETDEKDEEGLGKKGRKMKEEASDQDFNFW